MGAGGFRLDNLGDGTVSTPAINFNADTNTGIYRVGADTIALTSGGTRAFSTTLASGTVYAQIVGGVSSGAGWIPGMTFLDDADTGLMSITRGTIDLVADGRRILQASAYASASNYLIVVGGQVATPVILDVGGIGERQGIACATDFQPVAIAAGQQMRANTLYQENTPKAWCHFEGTGTPKIRSQFNIASITDIGTGDFRLNFNRAFASTAYAAIGMADANNDLVESATGEKDTTSYPIACIASTTANAADPATAYIAFWGPQ